MLFITRALRFNARYRHSQDVIVCNSALKACFSYTPLSSKPLCLVASFLQNTSTKVIHQVREFIRLMQQTSLEQPSFSPRSLSEPHFDEEATVLSARPVVPLSAVPTVNTKLRTPRPWLLGLGLVGALLVGVGATAFYFARQDSGTPVAIQPAEVTGGAQGGTLQTNDSIAVPVNAPPVVVQTEKAQPAKAEVRNDAPIQAAKPSVETPKKPAARLVAVIREKGNGTVVTTSGSREERKAERREARREQRRAERGRRDRRSDDVLRIQEIFEGSPRP